MVYRVNGPGNKTQKVYHDSAVCLGLASHRALDELFKMQDNEGRLPIKARKLKIFINSIESQYEEKKFSSERLRQLIFKRYEDYDNFDMAVKDWKDYDALGVKSLLEKIIDISTLRDKRLELVNEAVEVFSSFTQSFVNQSQYPKSSSIPPGIRKLAAELLKES